MNQSAFWLAEVYAMIQTLDGTREKNSTIVQFQRVSGIGTATVKTHKPQNNAIRYFRLLKILSFKWYAGIPHKVKAMNTADT